MTEAQKAALGELIAGDADLYEVDLLTAAEHILDRGYINEHIEEEADDYAMFAAAIASARIKGDKDRATQSSAPNEVERLTKCLAKANAGFEEYERRYLLGCDDIERLTADNARLRTVLHWIADIAYVDHQSGNENFEHLQSIARDALSWGKDQS